MDVPLGDESGRNMKPSLSIDPPTTSTGSTGRDRQVSFDPTLSLPLPASPGRDRQVSFDPTLSLPLPNGSRRGTSHQNRPRNLSSALFTECEDEFAQAASSWVLKHAGRGQSVELTQQSRRKQTGNNMSDNGERDTMRSSSLHVLPAGSSFHEGVEDNYADNDDVDPSLCLEGQASPSLKRPTQRVYYIDWLRIIAIYLVVGFHVVQALEWVGFFTGQSQKGHVKSFMSVSLQFGMPLFFHISGRAQALSKPSGLVTAFISRFKRLLVPFFICYAVLIPPWLWVHKREETDSEGNFRAPQNLFMYIIWYWKPSNFFVDPAWLWFLPVLFLISSFSAPFFLAAESGMRDHVYTGICFILSFSLMLLVALVPGLSWFFAFTATIGTMAPLFIAAWVPFAAGPPQGGAVDHAELDAILQGRLAGRLATIIQVLANVFLVCSFTYAELGNSDPAELNDHNALPMIIPMILLYLGFYQQGYYAMRWLQHTDVLALTGKNDSVCCRLEKVKLHIKVYQVAFSFIIYLVLALGAPVGEWEVPLFPIYSAGFRKQWSFAASHVLGSWAYVGMSIWVAQAYALDGIHPEFYKHASASTMIVYIFHWMFLKYFVWFVVRDSGMMNWVIAPIIPVIVFFVATGGSLGVYYLLAFHCKSVGVLLGL
jgi:peptidoglycan/LPS O-acetylase OafA/YrhL